MNEAQELQFRRLELCGFIGEDCWTEGKTVADDPRKHSDLWDSFLFGRFDWGQLIELRDLPSGSLNADTLFILTTTERKEVLLPVILRWTPDEYTATETQWSGCDSSAHTRHVADMLGVGQMPEGIVVFKLWWD